MAFERVHEFSDAQLADLHRLYQNEWWTKGRELEDVRRMLRCSDVLVAFAAEETGRLVAFARVLTDYVYKALVFDVIVDSAYRGRDLGAALMDAIVSHPHLKEVCHIELYCLPELIPFYEGWGFTAELGQLRFLRRTEEKN